MNMLNSKYKVGNFHHCLYLLRCCNSLWSRSCNGIPSSTNMAKIVTNVWRCSRYWGCWYWTGTSWQGSWFRYCHCRFLYCKTFLCTNSWSIRVTPLFCKNNVTHQYRNMIVFFQPCELQILILTISWILHKKVDTKHGKMSSVMWAADCAKPL